MRRLPIATVEHFFQHVALSEECWLWRLALNAKGYGKCWFRGQEWKAHRVAWTLFHGDIPDGLKGSWRRIQLPAAPVIHTGMEADR